MTLQATVSTSWANTVLDTAQRQGVAREHVLARAGIELSAWQRERWPIDYITRLWRAAVQCTQDPGFGLKVGADVGPASFNVVSALLQSAPNLREAIVLLQKYQHLISDGGRFQMIAGESASWLIYHPQHGLLTFSPHQIEAVLAAVVSFSRRVAGTPLRPQRVQFSQTQIGPLADYRKLFQCPVDFGQAFSGVLLENAVLDAALPQADAQLAHLHRQHAQARLASLSTPGTLVQELRSWIAVQLQCQLPTRGLAAQALGVTERTLARRMQAQQLSFTVLLDEARRDAALQAVEHSDRDLTEIGQSLGFAEPSTFWRAFHRWTGYTPGQWRRRMVASADTLARVHEASHGSTQRKPVSARAITIR
ncbi:AraC family transcriptional regulator [Rhodanobacter sp. AS-Z3]|uniref:AraC family transcriptional regulator n=1 Tax=Rhodanobacter sp. AS-Z3 TaxID=3031330 RepID=UPI00247AB4CC|nr:AraC family transcriptional regulator [Rhodanobacter sp. AS-Z3]WEN16707.1 AraC family transcriptional regulator [Rhodanobacter sp. AS-Z3]